VVMNLVVNARDAMVSGGLLEIETHNTRIDDSFGAKGGDVSPGEYVTVQVKDTGTGMDAETQSHLFEPFFTTKEKGKGTGLGLSTVYGIVKQSGGCIWVLSDIGQGTSFRICLPRTDPAAAPARAASVPEHDEVACRGTERILLVEDEANLRKLTREMLSRSGYVVIEAGDGREAISVEKDHPAVDLMISDVIMPGMSGCDAFHEIKRSRPYLKVLYVSAYSQDSLAQHGVLEPGAHFLSKPFTHQLLVEKVRAILDEHPPV